MTRQPAPESPTKASTIPSPEISEEELPALYRAADHVSLEAQRKYLLLARADLAVMIFGAVVASFSLHSQTYQRLGLGASAVLISVGAILTLMLSQKTYKRPWYGGRAAAESIKTMAWRYMMRAEPFDEPITAREIDELFTRSLREVVLTGDQLALSPHQNLTSGPQITERMRQIRALEDFRARCDIYSSLRIGDQQTWYGKKAADNARSESLWFGIVIAAQILGIVTAVALIVFPTAWFNPTGIFSTVAASALAWLQIRRHEELSQSYSVTAHELGMVAELARHVDSEEQLSTYVADAEAAISREHTLWLARRDQLLALD